MAMVSQIGPESQGLRTGSGGSSSSLGRSQTCIDEHSFHDHKTENQDDTAPLFITSKIPSRNAVISIAVIDGYSFTRESITRSLRDLCGLLEIQSFATSDQCLNSSIGYDVILYHTHQSVTYNGNGALTSFVKTLLPIAPVVILCDVDSSDSIRAAFDSGVRGYIPTVSTNLELAIEIMYLVKMGGTFVPPSGLSPRRVKPLETPDPVATQFTPRQIAVLDRLKLGKSNKIIAHELEMSQSSVKTHICNIMRKMNATNRTEVVCRAHELEMTATD